MNVTLGTYHTTPAIRAAVNAVLDSGRLSYGPVSRHYESRFAEMHGCKYGVVSNSGTSSLVVALQALKELNSWQDGDEVICPALTFVATINAVLHNRLTPVLVDVDSSSYNLNPYLIRQAITDRTRCLLPVHLFGQPADMIAIETIAHHHNLRVVEDSCETVLAKCAGYPIGFFGDVACFSTYTAHHLVTGVGGMAITDNHELAQLMRSLTNHGIDLAELPTGEQYDPSWLARKFRFNRVGHSFRITEIEAAIGLAQLNDLPAAIEKRQANAAHLSKLLKPLDDRRVLNVPQVAEHCTHSWMVYPIVLPNASKWPLMQHLQQHGIECREMMPLTNQPAYKFREADYMIAAWVNRNGFYVGCHDQLTTEQLDYMADTLTEYFNEQ